MTERFDICVIGAGSAGLSVAAGAALLGAPVALIEEGAMGGDCLNTGCVPSKTLLAAAKAAKAGVKAAPKGIHYDSPRIDFQEVMAGVHRVIAEIAPMDSEARFEGLGVTVIKERARFTGPRTVQAGERKIRARRFVIATGSRPFIPPLPGIDEVPYETNETIFDLQALPRHLTVIGGGPIGCELGLAFRRLGAEVTIVEMAEILPKDDRELAGILRELLEREGIRILEGTKVVGLTMRGDEKIVQVQAAEAASVAEGSDTKPDEIACSHILMAVGRRPNVEDLGLEKAGVAFDRGGIRVDPRLRTSNSKIFAAGDVAGPYLFTHAAGYDASVILTNALFRWPGKRDHGAMPWVTYTEPELAHVGLTEAEANRQGKGGIRIIRWSFAENDRARAERTLDGMVKIVASPKGKILGVSILGAQAGELIQPWVLAMATKRKLRHMTQVIAPYPTLGEAGKRAAGAFFAPKLFSDKTKKVVRFLRFFG
jgi:pyruvate/2-oxoglutarate dehydrogenase complex dihydrolipoamide dehydrogenase (E3) component